MDNFFELKFEGKKDEAFVELVINYDEFNLFCGKYKPEDIVKAKISEGNKLYDINRLQDPFNFIISEKLFLLLKTNKITGWDYYNISINGIDNKYYGFQTLGKTGDLITKKRTGFIRGYKYKESLWDKSDFFCPEKTAILMCTEKVKNLMLKNEISNVSFQNIHDVEWYKA